MGLFSLFGKKLDEPQERTPEPEKTPEQQAIEKENDQISRWGKSRRSSPQEKYRLLKDLAEEGFGAAQYDLGIMYQNGEYVEEDWERARELFMDCAEEIPWAAYELGIMGFHPEHYKVERDDQVGEGAYFLSQAAGRGLEAAFPEIQHWYHLFDGREVNPIARFFDAELKDVFNDLKEKADEKSWDAMGLFYQNGVYVEQDLRKAKECFERSVALNPDDDFSDARRHLKNPLFDLLEEDEDE